MVRACNAVVLEASTVQGVSLVCESLFISCANAEIVHASEFPREEFLRSLVDTGFLILNGI